SHPTRRSSDQTHCPANRGKARMPDDISEAVSHSVNPATGEPIARWPMADGARIEQSLALAHRASRDWRRRPVDERARLLAAIAAMLRERKPELARTITLEMGKPIAEAEAEVEKSAWNCEYVAAQG